MNLEQALLAPVFAHVLLVLIVGLLTVWSRFAAVLSGRARLKEIALNNNAWPADTQKLGNNFNNQFQVPTVWYACIALLLATGKADWAAVWLSWAFLATRILHAIEHAWPNVVRRRLVFFLAGYACVVAMWIWFALRLYVVG